MKVQKAHSHSHSLTHSQQVYNKKNPNIIKVKRRWMNKWKKRNSNVQTEKIIITIVIIGTNILIVSLNTNPLKSERYREKESEMSWHLSVAKLITYYMDR